MTKYERFVLWLNRFYHKQNKITICVLYTLIMAILGVLIYGATHQQANSSISVKYTVPSYTVTFDPNGGELSTIGGGVSSKIVKLGDIYGDLPVPTRTGYSFVGWGYAMKLTAGNNTNLVDGYTIKSGSAKEDTYFYVNADYKLTAGNQYLLRFNCTVDPDNTWRYCPQNDKSQTFSLKNGYNEIVFTAKENDNFFWDDTANDIAHPFTITDAHIEALTSSENITFEPGNFVTSSTKIQVVGDHTLTAMWIENSKTLFVNGNFEDVYTQTDTGWDNNINGTLHATSWEDYNRDIINASTSVHAHIKDISTTDSQHKHVFEMIGAHREYIAATYYFQSTTEITTGSYRFTASIKGVSGQNRLSVGLYYAKTGTGYVNSSFNSGTYGIQFGETDWFRVSWEFSVSQISYAHGFYIYGIPNINITPSMNNVFYLDDVFLEKIA